MGGKQDEKTFCNIGYYINPVPFPTNQ